MPSASPSGFSSSARERERAVLGVDDGVFGDPDGARAVAGLVTGDESWALGGQQCEDVVGERVDVVLAGFAVEDGLEFGEFLGVLGGQVGGVAEVGGHVVELPDVLVERHRAGRGGEAVLAVACAGPPAVVVDGTGAGEFEVLRRVPVPRFRVVEGVEHAHALHRLLVDAVDARRRGDAGALQDGRGDVDVVMELAADTAVVLDARRPGDDGGGAAAAARGHPLAVGERRGGGVGPGGGIGAVRLRAAQVVDVAGDLVERFRDAVEVAQLVQGAVQAALGRGAVVAGDVDDQRVLEIARLLDGLDEAAGLVIGVLERAAEDLHPAGADLLVGVAQLLPRRDARGAWRELGV